MFMQNESWSYFTCYYNAIFYLFTYMNHRKQPDGFAEKICYAIHTRLKAAWILVLIFIFILLYLQTFYRTLHSNIMALFTTYVRSQ